MVVEGRRWGWLWFGGRELEVSNFRVEINVTTAAWRSWLVHGCNKRVGARGRLFNRGFASCAPGCRCILPHSFAGRLRGVAKGVYFLKAVATNNILIPSVPLHDPEINTQVHPEACFACSALVSFFKHQIATKTHVFAMDRRGYESPMDFEYQNRPPVDPSSPFAKTTPFAKSAHQSSSKSLSK